MSLTTIPTVPPAPKGTPAWLIRTVALILPFVGVALVWVDPTGKLSTTAAQTTVVLVFLLAAVVIFTVHVVLGAVHEFGWSKAALTKVESDEIVELKAILPEFKAAYSAAKPTLDALPDFTGALAAVQTDVASVKAKVDQAPLVDRQAVEGIVKSLVIPNVLTPATAPVTAPPAAASTGNPLAEPAAP
jgi:hypothetical protein